MGECQHNQGNHPSTQPACSGGATTSNIHAGTDCYRNHYEHAGSAADINQYYSSAPGDKHANCACQPDPIGYFPGSYHIAANSDGADEYACAISYSNKNTIPNSMLDTARPRRLPVSSLIE